MESNRKPTKKELGLIEFLVENSSKNIQDNWQINLLVRSLNDGGMGGLLLHPNGRISDERVFGEMVSEYMYKDDDGVEVIVSLSVDDNGEIFELDIWKTNFDKLLNFPSLERNEKPKP